MDTAVILLPGVTVREFIHLATFKLFWETLLYFFICQSITFAYSRMGYTRNMMRLIYCNILHNIDTDAQP